MAPPPPQGFGHNSVETSADGMLTFKVELRRQPGARLGIDIVLVSSPQGCGLMVERVNEGGVVYEWNRKVWEPFRIRAGDSIVCVNGIEGNVQALGAELRSDRDISMTIQRACAEGTPRNWREMQASMNRQRHGTMPAHQQAPPDMGGDFVGMPSNPNAACMAQRQQHHQGQTQHSQQHLVQQLQQQNHQQSPQQQQQIGLPTPGAQQEQGPPQRMSRRMPATMPSQQMLDAPGMSPGGPRNPSGPRGPAGLGRSGGASLGMLSMEATDLGNGAIGMASACPANIVYDIGGEAMGSLATDGAGSHFTFQVMLVRPQGTRLGIDVLPVRVADLGGLSVKAISKGGVVEQWNQKCLECFTIRMGDCVVRVNGIVTETPQMMNELRRQHELRITILRGFGFQQCSSQPSCHGKAGGMIPPGISPPPPPMGPAPSGPPDGDWGGFPQRAPQPCEGKVGSMLPPGVTPPPPPPMGLAPSPPDGDWGPFPLRPEMGCGPRNGGHSPTASMGLTGTVRGAPPCMASGPLNDAMSAMPLGPNPALRRHPSVDMDVGHMPDPNFGRSVSMPNAGPPHRFTPSPGGKRGGGGFHGEDQMSQIAAVAAASTSLAASYVGGPPGPPGNDGNRPLTFEVEIEKKVGTRLGIDVMLLTSKGLNIFVVERVAEGGCVDLWNQRSMPPYQVLAGDYIIQVNGFTVWDNFSRMADELAPDRWQVCFTVQRLHANEGVWRPLWPSAAAADLHGDGSGGNRVGTTAPPPPPSAPLHSGQRGMTATQMGPGLEELGGDITGPDMLPPNLALGPWAPPVPPAGSEAQPVGPPLPKTMPTWRGQMGPSGAPPATSPVLAPMPPQQPKGPLGPPLFAFGKQLPSSQPTLTVPPPHFAGVPPPNLPTFAATGDPGRQSVQTQSFGHTCPAEMDEEPQPFGMPMPTTQVAEVPAATAFGLPVPLPTADEVGLHIDSYAASFPPPVTAALAAGEPYPSARTAFHAAEHMPVAHIHSEEPHCGMPTASVPLSGLAPPPGLDFSEPPATPLSDLNAHTTWNLQTGVESALAGNSSSNNSTTLKGTFVELEADMAPPQPSSHPSATLPPNADGVRADVDLDLATARRITSNGHDAADDEATHTMEPPAAADLDNSGQASDGGLGIAGATSAQTLKAALQTAASAGLVMHDPTTEPSLAAEHELPQEENRVPPAQLLMSTLQLGDEDLAQLLRLSLEDRPWLSTPVAEALSVLKPSRRTPAMAPLYRESLAASDPLLESSC